MDENNSREDGKKATAGSVYLKIHDTPEGSIVAMCDRELIGSRHSEGKMELDLETYAEFYKGDLLSPGEAESLLYPSDFYTANAVGKISVGILVGMKMAETSDIKKIGKVPCLYLFRMSPR